MADPIETYFLFNFYLDLNTSAICQADLSAYFVANAMDLFYATEKKALALSFAFMLNKF